MTTRTLTFAYNLQEEVITPSGNNGFVTMLGFDNAGKVYWVVNETHQQWYGENELSPKK